MNKTNIKSLEGLISHYEKQIERLEPHHTQYLERSSGFLDLSDSVDKMWEDEYQYKKQFLQELRSLVIVA